jgi:serine/threonine protein kinase
MMIQMEAGLKRKSPFPDLHFEESITKIPTGQSIVMKAVYQDTTPVAVKLFLCQHSGEYEDEMKMMGLFPNHPNLMQMNAEYSIPRKCFVFPLALGSLTDTLLDSALNPSTAANYGSQIAGGLAHMHAYGVAHLDIKGDNVLLCSRRGATFVVLTDYGLAMQVHTRSS